MWRLLAAILFCATPALAAGPADQPLVGPLRGGLKADSSSATIQPDLGRAYSSLADLYVERRIDKAGVERLVASYQAMLNAAGPTSIVAVSDPTPADEPVKEAPDGVLARALYESAISYGYPGAWVGLGDLYLLAPLADEKDAPEKAFGAFSKAAALDDSKARLRLAELTIRGIGTTPDPAAGVAMLRSLAESGGPRVLLELAALCLSGRIAPEPDLALMALLRAADLGSGDAEMMLGDLYARGEDIDYDDALAVTHYKQAAARGVQDAGISLAEMQARGEGMPKDVEAARTALDALAKAGKTSGLIALGDLYGTGEALRAEPDRARDFYAAAADQGSETGMLRLGDGYREGRFGPRNAAKAADFYRRAMETGKPGGLLALGRLQAASKKKKEAAAGFALLRKAFETKVDGSAVALAESHFYGYGTKQDPQAALDLLQKAADGGDREALLSLVAAYRDGKIDGKTVLVRKDTKKAQALLAAAVGRLSQQTLRMEQFLLDVSTVKGRNFAGLGDRFAALPRPERRSVLRDLPKANPGLYIWLAENRLRELGIFSGKTDGRADRRFTVAMAKHCAATLSVRQCGEGPLSRNVATTLSYAF